MTEHYMHPMKILMSNVYALFTQVQGFHWNVKGHHFFQLHGFFEMVYKDLFEHIDTLAERIRACDDYAPGTLSDIHRLQELEDSSEISLRELKVVEIFIKNCETVISQGKSLWGMCEKSGDLVTQDILIDLVNHLEKYRWMAKSYMEK